MDFIKKKGGGESGRYENNRDDFLIASLDEEALSNLMPQKVFCLKYDEKPLRYTHFVAIRVTF